MTSIAVIDHGAGNLVSMEQALVRVGANPTRVASSCDLSAYDGVVLPGVGAPAPAMRYLNQNDLVDPILSYSGPFLGVCVGMQLLFEHSEEDDTKCLGLIDGDIRRINATPLPHMGWNDVRHGRASIFSGLQDPVPFYFVHSFVPSPTDDRVIIGTATYGSDDLTVAVQKGSITGLQFHPERSGPDGLSVLENFVRDCQDMSRAA